MSLTSIKYKFSQTEHVDTNTNSDTLIYLDINGVLNNPDIYDRVSNHCINKVNLESFKFILRNCPQASIILSSSWRYNRNLRQCKGLINRYFNIPNAKVIGRTPVVRLDDKDLCNISHDEISMCKAELRNISRALEIEYVNQILNPTNYVILDNIDNFLDHQIPYCVNVDPLRGLTLEDAYHALEILGIEM